MLLSTIDLYSRWDGVVSSSEQWEAVIESQMNTKHANLLQSRYLDICCAYMPTRSETAIWAKMISYFGLQSGVGNVEGEIWGKNPK